MRATQIVFGDVYVGTSATATATWTNVTAGSAVATGVVIAGGNAPSFTVSPATLGNASVTTSQATPVVTFTFTPPAEAIYQAMATLQTRATATPLGLVGHGRFQINTGDLGFLGGGNLQPGQALNFGRMQVGAAPKTKQFQVANVGTTAVKITRVVFTTTGQGFAHTAPALPVVIQPVMGAMFTFTFTSPAFTAPPNQKKFTDAVTLHGEMVGSPTTVHSFGTSLCGVGFHPAEEPELKC